MTRSYPRLVLSSVFVEGLGPEAAEQAEAEIRRLLGPMAESDLDLIGTMDLVVLVTDRMEENIDRIRREYGISAQPYARERVGGTAYGLTLVAPGGPPFRATLVLHRDLWAQDAGQAVVQRVYMLGHLLGHALQDGRGISPSGGSEREDVGANARELRHAAASLASEFAAGAMALALCRSLSRSDGAPFRLSEFFGEDWIADLCQFGEKLCVFAAIDIQFYRVTGVGLEDLYPTVAPLLGAALHLYVRTIALYASEDNYQAALDALKVNPGCRTYILPEADAIVEALTDSDGAASEAQLVAILERTLERLGLRLEDTPDGTAYLHVLEPVQCPIGTCGQGGQIILG